MIIVKIGKERYIVHVYYKASVPERLLWRALTLDGQPSHAIREIVQAMNQLFPNKHFIEMPDSRWIFKSKYDSDFNTKIYKSFNLRKIGQLI